MFFTHLVSGQSSGALQTHMSRVSALHHTVAYEMKTRCPVLILTLCPLGPGQPLKPGGPLGPGRPRSPCNGTSRESAQRVMVDVFVYSKERSVHDDVVSLVSYSAAHSAVM